MTPTRPIRLPPLTAPDVASWLPTQHPRGGRSTSDDVHVERATSDDWERVRDLRLAALELAPDVYWATLEEERGRPGRFWRDRVSRPEVTTLIATVRPAGVGRRDAGLVTVGRSFDDPAVAGLYSLWVSPWARGRGVGDALVGAAITRAAAAGYRRMVLDVGDHNEPAIGLYERFGFTPTGRTARFPPPRDHITEHERALDLPATHERG